MDWKQPNVTWQSQGACKGSDPDFYDPAGELDDDFDAYRAVVGPA